MSLCTRCGAVEVSTIPGPATHLCSNRLIARQLEPFAGYLLARLHEERDRARSEDRRHDLNAMIAIAERWRAQVRSRVRM